MIQKKDEEIVKEGWRETKKDEERKKRYRYKERYNRRKKMDKSRQREMLKGGKRE